MATVEPTTAPVVVSTEVTAQANEEAKVNKIEEHGTTDVVGEEGAHALFSAARELEKSGKPEALDSYSKALETMVGAKGELSIDCVPFYEKYAKALLESSKLSGSVFALIEQQQKGNEECGNLANKEAPAVAEVSPKSDLASEVATLEAPIEDRKLEEPTAATIIVETAADVAIEEKSEVTSAKVETGVSPAEEKAEEKTGDKDMVGLRELAWELFETARVILEKQEPKDSLRLAGIHQNLGEVAMEDGNFARAYKEILEAINMLGKNVTESDERLAGAHQIAGLCSLYDQQMEAAAFHYTAAAEGFNFKLTDILVQNAVMESPKVNTEDIEFVDEEELAKLKAKLGEEHADFVKATELNGIINTLIERVNDINNQEEEDAKNPDIQSVVKDLASKLAVKFSEAAQKGAAVFDNPTSGKDETPVNKLVPTRRGEKRPCPVSASEDAQPPIKKAKSDSLEKTNAACSETTSKE